MLPRCDVREVKKVLERAGFENKDLVYDNGRKIVEKANLALKDGLKCSTRKHLVPYGLEEIELQHDEQKLNTAGALYIPLANPSWLIRRRPGLCRSILLETRGVFFWKAGLKMP